MLQVKGKVEPTRLAVLLACLGAVAVAAVVYGIRGGRLVGPATRQVTVDYEPRRPPQLEMGLIESAPAAERSLGRDPFNFGAPPTPTPAPTTPAPTRAPQTPTVRPTPRLALNADGTPVPPPPPFDREYIGHFGPVQLQVAAFRSGRAGDERGAVDVAVVGDVLEDVAGKPVYIVREIGLESVLIGFVGYDRSEDKRVPLAEQ